MLDAKYSESLVCEWDELRLFCISDIASEGLIRGWSNAEQSHIWNDGPEPNLRFYLRGTPRPALLQIEGMAFIRPSQPLQELTLFINGFRLGFWRLTTTGVVTIATRLEPEQMFVRGDSVLLDCTFHLPHSIRPMDLGEGTDRRELGFCFQSLFVGQVDAG